MRCLPAKSAACANESAPILLLAAALLLSACGGGGGGNPAPPPPPTNAAPTAQAGADQTIELPTNTVQVQGSATDDGRPSTTLTYTWTSSGSGVTFDNASAAATAAHFTAAGTYVLTLTVSDSALTGSDSVQVVVNPSVFPTNGWTSATPAEMNMDVARLDQARDYSLIGGGSGFITRRGRVVYTWGDTVARYDLKSTTKSIGGIALGLALDEGRLQLGDAAQMHLSTLGVPPDGNTATGWLDDITVLQLATHTAGFLKPGGYVELEYQPGTTWFYSDAGLNWLADVLTQLYAQDLNALLFSRVWSPMGITDANLQWRSHAFREDTLNGIKRREFASGISGSVDAMARIGYLFLRRGMWDGQRLLSESFIDTVRTPRAEIANAANPLATDFPTATTNFGVLWWTNTSGELADVPRDAYWAWGLGDSLIVVIPSLDLVIARTGNDPDDTTLPQLRADWNGDYDVLAPLLTPIVQAVTDD
jgi:CubicO group peptidase (beta-lactamase class C family)